jgi:hypothetical protein
LVNIALVVFAGLVSAAGVVIAFEYLSGGAQAARATADAAAGAARGLAGSERA